MAIARISAVVQPIDASRKEGIFEICQCSVSMRM